MEISSAVSQSSPTEKVFPIFPQLLQRFYGTIALEPVYSSVSTNIIKIHKPLRPTTGENIFFGIPSPTNTQRTSSLSNLWKIRYKVLDVVNRERWNLLILMDTTSLSYTFGNKEMVFHVQFVTGYIPVRNIQFQFSSCLLNDLMFPTG